MNRPIITPENSVLKNCNKCGLDKPRYRFHYRIRRKGDTPKLRGTCQACRKNNLSEQIFYAPEIQAVVDANSILIAKQLAKRRAIARRIKTLAETCYCEHCNANMGTYAELGSKRFDVCATCTTARKKREEKQKSTNAIKNISGKYLNSLLRNQDFKKSERTPELIELKRASVRLKREVKLQRMMCNTNPFKLNQIWQHPN